MLVRVTATRGLGVLIMFKNYFALLLAGALILPNVTAGLGNESTVGVGSSPSSVAGSRSDFGPAAVPPGESMIPFIQGLSASLLKLDTLGYFVVHPDIPGAQFCTGPKMTRIWTE